MPTLWEILTKKPEPAVESTVFNPLNMRLGNAAQLVKLLAPTLDDLEFKPTAIRETRYDLEGKAFVFVDYHLAAKVTGQAAVNRILRLIPAGETFDAILLEQIDECSYDKDFHKSLSFEESNGEFTDADVQYWRVNDVKEPRYTKTKLLEDSDGSGKVDLKEIVERKVTYWDYWREDVIPAAAGLPEVKVYSFYIVEMGTETGTFQFFTGKQIDHNSVIIA